MCRTWLTLVGILVEMKCPEHGLERFRIKIVTRFNIDADKIQPKFRSRPKPGELSCIYVGRNVSATEITNYLIDHFRRKGLWETILSIKFKTV